MPRDPDSLPEVGVFDMLRFHKFTIGWAAKAGDAAALLRVEISVGHGVGMPVSKQIEGRTDVLTFLTGALHLT